MRCNVCRCREQQGHMDVPDDSVHSNQYKEMRRAVEEEHASVRSRGHPSKSEPRKNISSSSSINKRRKPTNAGIDKRCAVRFGKEAMRSRENARKEAEKNRKGPEANQIEVVHRKSMRSGEKLASKTYDLKLRKHERDRK